MAEPYVSMATPAILPILLSGWGVSIGLYVGGIVWRRTRLVGVGILLSGFMVIVTSTLLFLRWLPTVSGGYLATTEDVMLIGLLGFLGGALAMLGASYVTIAARTSAAGHGRQM